MSRLLPIIVVIAFGVGPPLECAQNTRPSLAFGSIPCIVNGQDRSDLTAPEVTHLFPDVDPGAIVMTGISHARQTGTVQQGLQSLSRPGLQRHSPRGFNSALKNSPIRLRTAHHYPVETVTLALTISLRTRFEG